MQCVSKHLLAAHFLKNCWFSRKITLKESEQVLCQNCTTDSMQIRIVNVKFIELRAHADTLVDWNCAVLLK
jgi:hypothetical protein